MQRYLFIDTRHFDVRTTCIEVQKESFVILENRCYLEPCDEKVWMKQLPNTLKKIAQNNLQCSVIFIFPETSVLNLIIEVGGDSFPIEQKIARTLHKDYGLNIQKMCYKTLALSANKYIVTLVPKKFLKFIQRTTYHCSLTSVAYFPPIIGFGAYVTHLSEEKPFTALFIENHLRRFFTRDIHGFHFLDFQYVQTDARDLGLDSLKRTQQMVVQSLNLGTERKPLLLFGHLAPAMAELYQTEASVSCKVMQDIPELLGIKDPLSSVQQALYMGLCFLLQEPSNALQVFNFSGILTRRTSLQRKIYFRYEKFIKLTLTLWFIAVLGGATFYGIQRERAGQKLGELEAIKKEIKELKYQNKVFKKQNEKRLFLPKVSLQYCEWMQALPGRFCIDYISFQKENRKQYCRFNGRVLEGDRQVFEMEAKARFKKKWGKSGKDLDLKMQPDRDFCRFMIRIPVPRFIPSKP